MPVSLHSPEQLPPVKPEPEPEPESVWEQGGQVKGKNDDEEDNLV